jgi:hypothetical protein
LAAHDVAYAQQRLRQAAGLNVTLQDVAPYIYLPSLIQVGFCSVAVRGGGA